jgi:cold shock protein
MTEQGIVKWYSLAKGYGFIRREADEDSGDAGADVFFHHSEAPDPPPAEGEHVRFELVDGPKGLKARNVRRLSDAEPRPRQDAEPDAVRE